MNKKLILVDENDDIIGYDEKISTHATGKLHRAFSIFVYDFPSKKMLLQRRALSKYHSGGLWSNACCSHPIKDEQLELTMEKRLKEEMGINLKIDIKNLKDISCKESVVYDCGKFSYMVQYDILSENEIDRVFLCCPFYGISNEKLNFNIEEVSEIKWIEIDELKDWLNSKPNDFTAWFKDAFALVYPICCG